MYKKSSKKQSIMKLYKYSQETKAKVQEYRYHQSHLVWLAPDPCLIYDIASSDEWRKAGSGTSLLVGHAASWVDHKWRRRVLLALLS